MTTTPTNYITLGEKKSPNAPPSHKTERRPLTSFHLGTEAGRFQFLWTLSEEGEESLLTGTHHIWNSLNPPQAWRCAMIAQAAGLDGSGKTALYQFLKSFLETFDAECDPPPLPERSAFPDSEEWHTAVQMHFVLGEKKMTEVIERYATFLNSG